MGQIIGAKLLAARSATGGDLAAIMHMVSSTLPTLILSGGLDAQTPTFRSEEVARSLPNARLVVFPDGTHVQLGAFNVCAGQIMVAFVRDPKGALPLECAQTIRFPGFVLSE